MKFNDEYKIKFSFCCVWGVGVGVQGVCTTEQPNRTSRTNRTNNRTELRASSYCTVLYGISGTNRTNGTNIYYCQLRITSIFSFFYLLLCLFVLGVINMTYRQPHTAPHLAHVPLVGSGISTSSSEVQANIGLVSIGMRCHIVFSDSIVENIVKF